MIHCYPFSQLTRRFDSPVSEESEAYNNFIPLLDFLHTSEDDMDSA